MVLAYLMISLGYPFFEFCLNKPSKLVYALTERMSRSNHCGGLDDLFNLTILIQSGRINELRGEIRFGNQRLGQCTQGRLQKRLLIAIVRFRTDQVRLALFRMAWPHGPGYLRLGRISAIITKEGERDFRCNRQIAIQAMAASAPPQNGIWLLFVTVLWR